VGAETAQSLRISVLGPVRAWRGEAELMLGQPRQRAVLAVLAVHANKTVSREQLIDAVWGDQPPTNAAGGVHTYVAGLRVIEPDRCPREAGQVLVGHGAGYRLRVDPALLDVNIFEQLLANARTLPADGWLARLLEALDLWQGVPFASVPGPFVETERIRLEQLRLAALEDLAAAKLRLGRHPEVAADLSALTREHPLRERLRALQMLALYRCGRQADALRVYVEVRRQLVDELGIEPGRELQQMHQDVLLNAANLDPERTRVEAPTAVGDAALISPETNGWGDPTTQSGHRPRRLVRRQASVAALLIGAVLILSGPAAPAHRATPQAPTPSTASQHSAEPLVPGDNDRFIADVTIPDGTTVHTGQQFTKTWEIQNTGTMPWHNRFLQRQGLLDGPGLCASVARVPVQETQPGQDVRISVTFTAPKLPGSCYVDWKIVDANGHLTFPHKAGLYVTVNVTD
jgi:DNA-binding SARP family transcriptional activator